MKTTTLALLLLICGTFGAHAAPTLTVLSSASVHLQAAPAPSLASSTSHFAQLGTLQTVPVSSTLVVTLIALFILGLRLMGVRHAHSLARHERHSHDGRAEMFRSLHEERSSRR
jgi:hypothetical protein